MFNAHKVSFLLFSCLLADCPLLPGHVRGDLHAVYLISPPKVRSLPHRHFEIVLFQLPCFLDLNRFPFIQFYYPLLLSFTIYCTSIHQIHLPSTFLPPSSTLPYFSYHYLITLSVLNPSQLGLSGEEYDDDHRECMLSFIAQMDPKGWIPKMFGYQQESLLKVNMPVLTCMLKVMRVRYNTVVRKCIDALALARTHDHSIVCTYVHAYKHCTHTH